MKLWLARHAQPLVAPGICYGQLDLAADAAATADCARRLALELPAGIRVSASPLQRCAQLAQALLALRPDLLCHTDARLQEMDFGRWEGRAWQDIAPAELAAWTDDFAHYPAGGTGESVSAFMARVSAAFDALGTAPENATLWITHAGVIRAAGLLAQGVRHIAHARQWPQQAPGYGQWQRLALDSRPAPAADGACG
jgi:alpha-ribazole phosphatase